MTTRFTAKQPSEEFFVSFNFSALLNEAETIASAVITAADPDGADVSASILDGTKQTISTPTVYGWVQGGESGSDYLLTCHATSSDGALYELEAILPVIEEPDDGIIAGGLVSGPSEEPVTLTEIKIHLRIDHSDEDSLLNELIEAAREYIEDITRRAILTQTWDFPLSEWPARGFIKLPLGNLQSVSSVRYRDVDGVEHTLSRSVYFVERAGEGIGRVVLAPNQSWPSATLYPGTPISVRYVCGWASAAAVPYKIKAALKLVCADLYEMRGEPVAGQVTETKAVQRLLASARLYDEF